MAKLINFFFNLQVKLKLYHWNTTSFSRHKASDELYGKIQELSDQFVEVFIGKYGRIKVTEPHSGIKITSMNDSTIVHFLRKQIEFLSKDIYKHINPESDTDLVNIRDELLACINQTLYLFTLE